MQQTDVIPRRLRLAVVLWNLLVGVLEELGDDSKVESL